MPKQTSNKPAGAKLKRRKPVQCSAMVSQLVRIENQIRRKRDAAQWKAAMDAERGRKFIAWIEIHRRIKAAREQLQEMLANSY